MFNKALKHELLETQQQLVMYQQCLASIQSDMLHLSLNPQGNITIVNPLFTQETGLTQDAIAGQNLAALVPVISRKSDNYQQLKQALAKQQHWVGAIEIANATDIYWLRIAIQPMVNHQGVCQSLEVFASNLTRTITTAHQYENLITAINRSMAVIEFSLDGIVLNANDIFLRTMGYNAQQVLGKHHRIFCPNDLVKSAQYERFGKECTVRTILAAFKSW